MKHTTKTLAATAGLIGLAALPATAQKPNLATGLQVTSVNPDATGAAALVSSLLGAGVTLVGTPTLVGNVDANGDAQQGLFTTNGPSVVGFDNGILLTSGYASNAVGPNSATSTSKSWGSAGDPDLSSLIGGQATNDANVLTFQFTVAPTVKDLAFTYAFGSEEYPEFVGSFNDPFGFFVDGKNVALIPGTNDPVTVNSIASGPNSMYLINNNFQDGTAPVDTEYDGLTVPLIADVSPALDPTLQVHTIKLAISDALDTALDSGVFIAGGSFTQGGKPPPPAVPEPSSFALLGLGMGGLVFVARKRRSA